MVTEDIKRLGLEKKNIPLVATKEQYHSAVILIASIIGIAILTLISGCREPVWAMETKLSQHFVSKEFACHHCGETKVNIELIIALEKLRSLVNAPIVITSGYRCPLHNKVVGGARNSQHKYGNAVDIKIKGYSPAQVARLAKKCGFTWTKTYSSWTHIDVRQS
jgi:hypothetical protein